MSLAAKGVFTPRLDNIVLALTWGDKQLVHELQIAD